MDKRGGDRRPWRHCVTCGWTTRLRSRHWWRSWHHSQQLRDLLHVAGGVGSDAAAEAVDERAKAMQLDVVDSRIVDVGWLSRNRESTVSDFIATLNYHSHVEFLNTAATNLPRLVSSSTSLRGTKRSARRRRSSTNPLPARLYAPLFHK